MSVPSVCILSVMYECTTMYGRYHSTIENNDKVKKYIVEESSQW